MASTLVTFLSRTEFDVSLNGNVGKIKIVLFPKNGTERVIGLTVSQITVEIPYSVQENEEPTTNKKGYVSPPTSPIKREALN
jgi:hypothetical protein